MHCVHVHSDQEVDVTGRLLQIGIAWLGRSWSGTTIS